MKLSEMIIELLKDLALRGDRPMVQKYGDVYLEIKEVTIYNGPYPRPDAGNLIVTLHDA